MDPKTQVQTLDPKLREVYERVMGTPVSPAVSTPPPVPPQPQSSPQPFQPPPPLSHVSPQQAPPPNPLPGVVVKPSKFAASNVILILAGAFFFIVYTVFWIRFFNLSIPFLTK